MKEIGLFLEIGQNHLTEMEDHGEREFYYGFFEVNYLLRLSSELTDNFKLHTRSNTIIRRTDLTDILSAFR
jgi:hypothetical protein